MQLAMAAGGIALGGVAGSLVPGVGVLMGAQIGFLGATILHGILFPNKIDVGGPSRDDVRLSSTATGRFIPIPWVGSVRIGGQYRWVQEPLITEFTDEIGGKGGGTEIEGTKLFLTWNVGICEAPGPQGIKAVTKIWLDDELVFDISEGNPTGPAVAQQIDTGFGLADNVIFDGPTQTVNVPQWGPIRIYLGQDDQPAEPLMQLDERITTAMGSDAADWVSPFFGLCHCTFTNVPGESINGHFPQCEFEVLVDGAEVFEAIHFEPLKESAVRSRVHILKDRNTFVSGSSTTAYQWNMIAMNPLDPLCLPWHHFAGGLATGRDVGGPFNVGTWDDPDIVGINGSTTLSKWSFRDGFEKSASDRSVGTSGQPSTFYYYPDTASPSRVIMLYGTQNQIACFNFHFGADQAEWALTKVLHSTANDFPIPQVGIVGASWHIDRAGFVGPDGLLYVITGESSGSEMAIVAISFFTLNVTRAFKPYRTTSPETDDDFYDSCEMTYDYATDKIILFSTAGKARRIDRDTLTLDPVDDIDIEFHVTNSGNIATLKHGPVSGLLWIASSFNVYNEIDVRNWRLTGRSIPNAQSRYTISGNNFTQTFDPWNNGLWVADFLDTDQLDFLPLDRIGPTCGTAQDVADRVSAKVGFPTALVNTALWSSDIICGYMSGRRITGRKTLEPIAGAINGDYRTQDAVVQFYKKDVGASVSIPEDDLGYADTLEAKDPRRDVSWPYERDKPIRVDMTFVDRKLDYSPNTVYYDRPQLGFRGSDRETVQMPIVFDDASSPQAHEIAERLLHEFSINDEQHALLLSSEYLGLNVGDAVNYTVGTRTHTVRLTKYGVSETNKVALQAYSEDITLHTPSGGGAVPVLPIFETPSLGVSSGAELFLIDSALLRTQDDLVSGFAIYAAISPQGDNFKGGTLFRSTDGGATWDQIATFTAAQTVRWGQVAVALPDARIGIEDTQSMTVDMKNGFLPASVSKTDLDNDPELNAVLYGADGRWEILRYRTSVDSDGSPDESGDEYVVTNMRRGYANTAQNTGNHRGGDRLFVLEDLGFKRITLAASDIGVEYLYRFVPVGGDLSQAVTIKFTAVAETKKPAILSEVSGSRNISTGDWTVTGCRGGRIDYAWVDFVTTPLGEDTEEYEIDVLTGPGGTVIAGLTQTGLSSASATFTEADLITYGLGIDGSPGQSPFALTVKWYQISAVVGRGNTEEITLTSPTPGN